MNCKVSPRFTLTMGVRYEPFLPWVEKNDRINTVAPGEQSTAVPDAPPGILFPGDLPRGLAENDLNNFAARIGLAWDVTGRRKDEHPRGIRHLLRERQRRFARAGKPAFCRVLSVFSGRIENPFGSVGRTPPPVETSGKFGCVKISAIRDSIVRCFLCRLAACLPNRI